MTYTKLLAGAVLAASLALPGAPALLADDWHYGRHDRNEVRRDQRELYRDAVRMDAVRDEVMRDRMRLNAALRRGDRRAAARYSAEVNRGERALGSMMRETRRDRRDYYDDRRDLRRDYRDDWR